MSDETVPSRWSKRKQAVLAEKQAEELAAAATLEAENPVVEVEKTDAEILAEHDLKDPDDLEPGDDFSGFMKSTIPTALRNRALRRLWTSNSVLANLDGLLDYGDDFHLEGKSGGVIASAYKVGKGYFDKLKEKLDEDDEIVDESTEPEVEGDSAEPEETATAQPIEQKRNVRPPGQKPDLTPISKQPVQLNISEEIEIPKETTRKRMVFSFDS